MQDQQWGRGLNKRVWKFSGRGQQIDENGGEKKSPPHNAGLLHWKTGIPIYEKMMQAG